MRYVMLFLCIWATACNKPASGSRQNTETAAETTPSQSAEPDTTPAAPETTQTKDVLYYYRTLEAPFATEYPLQESKGKWVCLSPSTSEPLEDIVVDLNNGFIQIVDPGTGGGDWTIQCVLFRMANGAPVLGLSKTFFDGTGIRQDIHILRPEDARRRDWTDYALPKIDGFSFLRDDSAEEEEIVHQLLPVTIELPRYGTTAKAKVYTGLQDLYCRGGENEFSDYCGLFQQVRRAEILLKWNKEQGKFVQ
ncbi:MAG: hypothetical protein KBG02_15660 [Haliscomenobacter sp.]|nr:hypothetical protein [Haliscomenobacter sp.]